MKRNSTISALLFLVLLPAACPLPAQSDTVACEVEVTEPRPGQQVGAHIAVRGKATLSPGHHLWVFARRIDFEPLWWPQREGRPDPETGRWRAFATLGMRRDIGWEFDLAVAVFAEEEHLQLREYWTEAMRTDRWLPIEMPEAACPPTVVTVTKATQ